jgi:hypothetical protein
VFPVRFEVVFRIVDIMNCAFNVLLARYEFAVGVDVTDVSYLLFLCQFASCLSSHHAHSIFFVYFHFN